MSTLISVSINPSLVTNTSLQPNDRRVDLLPEALSVYQSDSSTEQSSTLHMA